LTALDFTVEPGPAAEVTEREEVRGCVRETWRIAGSLGEAVAVDAYLSAVSGPVVIGCHGKDDSRQAQYLRGPAAHWAARGISLVAMDAPLHGERSGERPVPAVTITDLDLLNRWVKDHRLLVEAVVDRFGPEAPIAFLGMSMGAVMGCHLMAAEPRLAAGILVVGGSTVYSVPEWFEDAAGLGELLALTDPRLPAGRIAPRPVLMLNADDDAIFSRHSALDLYDAMAPPKEITFFPGGHARWRSPAQWHRRMLRFLEDTVGGKASP
jgi:alpha-beta hydrolase superfamily lysophospholipase